MVKVVQAQAKKQEKAQKQKKYSTFKMEQIGDEEMEIREMEQELQEYLKSERFQNDCLAIKAYYTVFGDELPTDLEIEQEAVCEQRIYFENIKMCMDKGHDWEDCEEEVWGKNEKYRYCRRCGKTDEAKK